MPAFLEAARRHWRDADHLLQNGQTANADHLAGFSAECGIKAFLCGLCGVPTPQAGPPAEAGLKFSHLPALWSNAATYLHGRTAFAATNTAAILSRANPFATWSVSDRYENDAVASVIRATGHVNAARQILSLTEQAHLNGVLP
jgi:hypothetical protein